MKAREVYDIPDEIFQRDWSEAFSMFFSNWFEDSQRLIRGEFDTDVLKGLSSDERDIARELIRRNLHLGYGHLVEGVATLDDREAVPILLEMLESSKDLSRKLTVAGSLWKIARHPSFPDLIETLVQKGSSIEKQAHFDQILWPGDRRTIIWLIELLNDPDAFVVHLALTKLNEFDANQRFMVAGHHLPKQPKHFLRHRDNETFQDELVKRMAAYQPRALTIETASGPVTKQA